MKFPDFSTILCTFSQTFPLFCVIFPDLSSLFKNSLTGKYLPIFQVFQSEWEPSSFIFYDHLPLQL